MKNFEDGLIVVSLFDGCAMAYEALLRAGFKIKAYYASEVDKPAMQIAMKNHPDIIQMGDVTKLEGWMFPEKVDLLIGGSPCQGFSFAGKQLNFDDPRSKLFFEYVRLLEELKPEYFVLENVNMQKQFRDVITEKLGVEPININSNLVSAQNRNRWYWTNIKGLVLPMDKNILLKDIVHEHSTVDRPKSLCLLAGYDGKFTPKRYFEKSIHQAIFDEIGKYIVPFDKTLKILENETQKGKIGFFKTDSQGNRIYSIHKKSVTICGEAGGRFAKTGGYLSGCITPDRVEKRQNGQRFNEGHKFYTLTGQDQRGVLVEGYIRKLTPVECERLQTLPDNYTEGVSNTQRYKMLGNGFTVDVIAHVLSFIYLGDL